MAPLTEFEQFLQALGLLQGPALAAQDIPYAGMDNGFYPGKKFMDYFRANTNIVWTGVYLSATGHGGTDWELGTPDVAPIPRTPFSWGIATIYFGSQDKKNPQKNVPFNLTRARL